MVLIRPNTKPAPPPVQQQPDRQVIVQPRPVPTGPPVKHVIYPHDISRTAAIDVLYPVYTTTDNEDFFRRMQCSVDSLIDGVFTDFVICVSDTSREPLKPRLDRIIPVPYRYVHLNRETTVRTGYGHFSKPYTMNHGVKTLVTAPLLKISDVDIVYCRNHLQRVVEQVGGGKTDVLTYVGHKMLEKFYHHNSDLLIHKMKGERLTTPGIPTMRTEYFHRLRGYNEHPDYVGLEDVEFLLRAAYGGLKVLQNWDGVTVVHLWHEKVWAAEQTVKDRELYEQTREKLRRGELNSNDVNPGGYGEEQGIMV